LKPLNVVFITLFCAVVSLTAQERYTPDWSSLDQRTAPEWYSNAKFGIFIHWGLYSVPAWATDSYADGFGSNYAEWYWQRLFAPQLKIHKDFTAFHDRVYGADFKYPEFASRFQCELFDPGEWADMFVKSGAKYVVLTSKHHDGYCLWPSKEAWNWNAVDHGPGRDLVAEVTAAVKAKGLKMGLYYSLYEWFNPMYKKDISSYVAQHMLPQMKDLVYSYEPEILWADGDWEHPAKTWKTEEFCAWLYNDSPVKQTIVVNDRLGNDTQSKHGTFSTSEYGKGHQSIQRPWEETRGIGQSFGYNRNENLNDYATGKELVHQLIRVVAGGGNFLLNIGPDADGTIPVIMQERLSEIGNWMKVNGEAIYNTRPWKEENVLSDSIKTVFLTQNATSVFAICTDWQHTMRIPFSQKPQKVNLLGLPQDLPFTYKKGYIIVNMPALLPGKLPCEYAWTLKITPKP
jgi:alpha-L-fucosidase